MKNCIIENLKYFWYSKKVLILLVCSVSLIIGVQLLNYSALVENYEEYCESVEQYKSHGTDVDEALEEDYSCSMSLSGNSGTVENPLVYYKEIVKKYVYSISPQNATSQMQESTLILFPMMLVVIASMVTSMDRNGKNYKIKKIRYSKKKYFVARQLTIYILMLGNFFCTFVIGKISNYIIYWRAMHTMDLTDLTDYDAGSVSPTTKIMRWMILAIFAMVIVEVSSVISNVCKNSIVSIILMYTYFFIINWKEKWDIKNSIYYLFKKHFDLCGIITVNQVKSGIDMYSCSIIIMLILVVSVGCNYLLEVRRSGFNG